MSAVDSGGGGERHEWPPRHGHPGCSSGGCQMKAKVAAGGGGRSSRERLRLPDSGPASCVCVQIAAAALSDLFPCERDRARDPTLHISISNPQTAGDLASERTRLWFPCRHTADEKTGGGCGVDGRPKNSHQDPTGGGGRCGGFWPNGLPCYARTATTGPARGARSVLPLSGRYIACRPVVFGAGGSCPRLGRGQPRLPHPPQAGC